MFINYLAFTFPDFVSRYGRGCKSSQEPEETLVQELYSQGGIPEVGNEEVGGVRLTRPTSHGRGTGQRAPSPLSLWRKEEYKSLKH